MNNKLLFFCLIVIVAIVSYYFAKTPERIETKYYKVEKGEVKVSVSNTRVGTIKACRRAYFALSTGGNVNKLFVKEGG